MKKILNTYWNVKTPSSYIDLVKAVVTDSNKFNTFRKEKQYAGIVENLVHEDGSKIIQTLPDNILELLRLTEDADRIGSPLTFNYSGLKISPTTLRYAKVVHELSNFFHDFANIENIAEIGVGYGGQARLICQYMQQNKHNLKSYTLIDLPCVLELTKQYLEHFSFSNSFEYKSKSELSAIDERKFDFVISNYAFSEFGRSLQEEYLEKIILQSKAGYLLMNNGKTIDGKHVCGEYGNKECILDEELLKLIPNSKILESNFLSSNGIYLLAFGL